MTGFIGESCQPGGWGGYGAYRATRSRSTIWARRSYRLSQQPRCEPYKEVKCDGSPRATEWALANLLLLARKAYLGDVSSGNYKAGSGQATNPKATRGPDGPISRTISDHGRCTVWGIRPEHGRYRKIGSPSK